jgi:ATP-dependent Lon protease
MMLKIISSYTRESGVRELERLLNTVVRKVATKVVSEEIKEGKQFKIGSKHLKKYLGPAKFDRTAIESEPQVGLVNGLAWTPVGGELLHIEVVTTAGTGKFQVTGKLGEVMQESAKAALSYVRSISDRLGVDAAWYEKNDIHIHIPEGATPKDGPSAGVTIATALTSAISGIKVWQDVAMTGEITVRGRVLPIGGLKEKLLAAKQAGIKRVLIPQKNMKDLEEIPANIKGGVEVLPCTEAEEVLRSSLALDNPAEFMRVIGLSVVEGGSSSKEPVEVAN